MLATVAPRFNGMKLTVTRALALADLSRFEDCLAAECTNAVTLEHVDPV